MRQLITPSILLALAMLGTSGAAIGANCTVNLEGNDRMQFNLKEATVSASCDEITVNLKHTGNLPVAAMGHNVVIAKTPDVAGLSADAIKAGAANGYLPPGDPRTIAATEMIGGGQASSVRFPANDLKAGGDYTFFCSFPGHAGVMKGALKVTD